LLTYLYRGQLPDYDSPFDVRDGWRFSEHGWRAAEYREFTNWLGTRLPTQTG
jgi:hypothetical protein